MAQPVSRRDGQMAANGRSEVFPIYREDARPPIPEIHPIWWENLRDTSSCRSARLCAASGWQRVCLKKQLGLESGVQRNFISLIETGQNQPTITTIARLARALGMKASQLVAEAERQERVRR